MATNLDAGLDTTLCVFLVLCACICLVCLLVELSGSRARPVRWYRWLPRKPDKQTLGRLMHLPWIAWSFCLLVEIIRLAVKPGHLDTEPVCSGSSIVNPDIGGIGVRIGLEVVMGWTLVSLLLGAVGYRGETGTKELAAMLFVNLIYIVFNLAKALPRIDELNFTEVMTICMCIDGLCATITMTLSDKTALASRWYVYLASAFQLLALIMMFVALGLWHNNSATPDCCTTIVWWGTASSCRELSRATIFYLLARTVTWLHGACLALDQTSDFDRAKKLHDSRHAKRSGDSSSGFDRLPGTAFSAYWASLPGMVVAWVGLEKVLHTSDSGSISDWGQSAALLTAIAGILHWTFAFNRGWRSLGTSLKRFDPTKHQFLDHTRLNQRRFPDALEMDAIPLLQQDLVLSVRIRDDERAADILDAIRRREERGERISVDFVDPGDQKTPLQVAIERGSYDLVVGLLKLGAGVDVPRTEPALVTATKNGQWDILQYLIGNGRCSVASAIEALEALNVRFEARPEPEFATGELLRYICSRGIPMSITIQHQLTDLASQSRHTDFFRKIVACGLLNQHSRTSEELTLLEAILDYPPYVSELLKVCPHWFDDKKPLLSALVEAIRTHNKDSILVLLDLRALRSEDLLGPEVHVTRQDDLLSWAVSLWRPDILETLLDMNAPISGYVECTRDGLFPVFETLNALQLAASKGYLDVIAILLKAGLDVNAPAAQKHGRMALAAAAEHGHSDVVTQLLAAGADVNAPAGRYRDTPLSSAAIHGHSDVVAQLLAAGGRLNTRDMKLFSYPDQAKTLALT